MSDGRLTQKDVALFFFPLLLNVQLMSVSHSIINAGLARLENAVVILAGFSVAMVLHLFVASPSYQNHTITIAMVRGRRSLVAMILFVLLIATWVSVLLALLAFSPVGIFVLDRMLGVTPEVAEGAREALGLLVFLPFITGLRGLCQGLVIRARRTGLVSLATAVRIAMLFVYLWLGQLWFTGTEVAAFALLGCVGTETLVIAFFAWRVKLPAEQDDERSFADILRYGLPLAYSSGLQQTVPLLINAIISRLPDGTLALAAFGVIRGFLFLLAGPMRNLQQAYLTLVTEADDNSVLVRFLVRVSCGMALIMLLIAWPLNAPGPRHHHGAGRCHAALHRLAADSLCPLPPPLRRRQPAARLVLRCPPDRPARPFHLLQSAPDGRALAADRHPPAPLARDCRGHFPVARGGTLRGGLPLPAAPDTCWRTADLCRSGPRRYNAGMAARDQKHPCPDCRQCQWCSDDRCRLCLKSATGCRRKMSMAEQIALYEQLNASAPGKPPSI